ncbi:hypothetical protein FNQ90_00650 [Streptomyces alkaliphilus]|uniref:Uncharacterized protein n=1 Tax=Streptomyces alkaliphilus TaxID=1472722 RepID=A0A7W3XZU4_9ACTN|nr:hypothetical protein [Streptomyces alkaliphilus]MBB0242652.1 hypothetical protein [Streptomyces alkaliphilus]
MTGRDGFDPEYTDTEAGGRATPSEEEAEFEEWLAAMGESEEELRAEISAELETHFLGEYL